MCVNLYQIPVNCPKHASAHASHRDGRMRVDGNNGAMVGYEPDSFGEWQEQARIPGSPPLELSGAAQAWDFRENDSDYYTQPGMLFRLMSKAQQEMLCEKTARAMGVAPEFIRIRHIGYCLKADKAYGRGVADPLGISLDKV